MKQVNELLEVLINIVDLGGTLTGEDAQEMKHCAQSAIDGYRASNGKEEEMKQVKDLQPGDHIVLHVAETSHVIATRFAVRIHLTHPTELREKVYNNQASIVLHDDDYLETT